MIIDYSSNRGEQETEVATHVLKQEVFERRDCTHDIKTNIEIGVQIITTSSNLYMIILTTRNALNRWKFLLNAFTVLHNFWC